jgi:sulfite reductase (ferredoxin)
LVKNKNPFVTGREQLISDFRTLYCDTKIFYDPFAGDRFANFFFKALETNSNNHTADGARQRLEEAQLFIEAAHSCLARAV